MGFICCSSLKWLDFLRNINNWCERIMIQSNAIINSDKNDANAVYLNEELHAWLESNKCSYKQIHFIWKINNDALNFLRNSKQNVQIMKLSPNRFCRYSKCSSGRNDLRANTKYHFICYATKSDKNDVANAHTKSKQYAGSSIEKAELKTENVTQIITYNSHYFTISLCLLSLFGFDDNIISCNISNLYVF